MRVSAIYPREGPFRHLLSCMMAEQRFAITAPYTRHSRGGGNPGGAQGAHQETWIPAFAVMTTILGPQTGRKPRATSQVLSSNCGTLA